MHELPVTQSILDIVLKHAQMNQAARVMTIYLQIGRLSDMEDEWLQHYFDYLSKGTIAEGAKLKVERTPIVIQCVDCQVSYEADPAQIGTLICPECGAKSGMLISGREYSIKSLEVQ